MLPSGSASFCVAAFLLLRYLYRHGGFKEMWQITATFNLFGWQTHAIDLTPVIGIGLIATIVLLVGATTFG
jgi:hypothetical protein